MKYSLSRIMKRAWEMRKSYSCRSLTFGECLRRAWKEAKAEYQNSPAPEKFENGMEITADGYTRSLSRWSKGDHDRIYINGGSRNGDGYVDLKSRRAFLRGNLAYQVKMAEKILAMAF